MEKITQPELYDLMIKRLALKAAKKALDAQESEIKALEGAMVAALQAGATATRGALSCCLKRTERVVVSWKGVVEATLGMEFIAKVQHETVPTTSYTVEITAN